MTDDKTIIRGELERGARVFGLVAPLDDAMVLGGDLFAQVRVVNGRVSGVSAAMSSLRSEKPHLFRTAKDFSAEERAARLSQIRRDHEHGLDKSFHDRMIGRMKSEQAKYIAKRDANR